MLSLLQDSASSHMWTLKLQDEMAMKPKPLEIVGVKRDLCKRVLVRTHLQVEGKTEAVI